MKRFLSFSLPLIISTIFTVNGAVAELQALDHIVAIVDKVAITHSELESELRTVKLQIGAQGGVPPDAILKKQVLERLILKHIQLQLARSSNIHVDDDTLNRALATIATQNQLTLAQFREVLEMDGYDFRQFREDIRAEIITTRLRQRHVDNRIIISDREIDRFLIEQKESGQADDEYRLGHILITVPEAAAAAAIQKAKQRAELLLDELREGADFNHVAISSSEGRNALEGGDLGWRKAGQLPSLFATLAITMQVGDISELIRSPSGFHIIKLLEHRGGERHVVTQTNARHILIKVTEVTSDSEAQQKLWRLKERIESGDDFSELARSHSDDAGTAAKGGDLGWSSPGRMVAAFEAVMDSLQPGPISEPFKSRFGWHIVQIQGRRDHDDTEEFNRNQARMLLMERKVAEEQELWLRRLRDEAYVEIR